MFACCEQKFSSETETVEFSQSSFLLIPLRQSPTFSHESLFFTLPVRVYSLQPLLNGCYPGISKQQLLPGHSTTLALQHTLGPSPQPWRTPTTLTSVLNVYMCVCICTCLHAHARSLLEDMEGAYMPKYKSLRQFDRRTLGLTFQANGSASYGLV